MKRQVEPIEGSVVDALGRPHTFDITSVESSMSVTASPTPSAVQQPPTQIVVERRGLTAGQITGIVLATIVGFGMVVMILMSLTLLMAVVLGTLLAGGILLSAAKGMFTAQSDADRRALRARGRRRW